MAVERGERRNTEYILRAVAVGDERLPAGGFVLIERMEIVSSLEVFTYCYFGKDLELKLCYDIERNDQGNGQSQTRPYFYQADEKEKLIFKERLSRFLAIPIVPILGNLRLRKQSPAPLLSKPKPEPELATITTGAMFAALVERFLARCKS